MKLDPVCGMDADERFAAGKSEYKGTTYCFCSLGCKKRFDADPEQFIDVSDSDEKQPAQTTHERDELDVASIVRNREQGRSSISRNERIHTCPMHPEILQTGPGSCPKCGMALEPL